MRKIYSLVGMTLLGILCLNAQTPIASWGKQFNVRNTTMVTPNAAARAVLTDARSNVITVGSFNGITEDLNPDPTVTVELVSEVSSMGNSTDDIFIAKYDSAGNFIWARKIGGNQGDVALDAAIDADNNILVTGRFSGMVDFDPGAGVMAISGANDAFILKLDSSGTYIWAKSIGGSSADEGVAIATDSDENVYVTGTFQGTADFDPGAASITAVSQGGTDIFLVKLDKDGIFQHARVWEGTGNDYASDIAVNNTGNMYLAGYYEGDFDLDPSIQQYLVSPVGGRDFFLVKLDSTAKYSWAYACGGEGGDQSVNLKLDAAGNVFLLAYVSASNAGISFAGLSLASLAGTQDMVLAKLYSNGNPHWVRQLRADGANINALTLDATANVFIAGAFFETMDFDPGSGTSQKVAYAGSYDLFVLKLDSSFNYQWVAAYGELNTQTVAALTVDAAGSVFICGNFTGSLPIQDTLNSPPPPSGPFADMFVAKIAQFNAGGGGAGLTEMPRLQINCYPNPAGAELLVKLEAAARLEIYNLLGEQLLVFDAVPGINQLPLGLLSTGTYTIRSSDGATAIFLKQ